MKINRSCAVLCGVFCTFSVQAATVYVGGGTVHNDAALSAGTVFIAADAVLSGSGTIEADLVIAGACVPGADDVGTQRVVGSLGFLPGSRFICQATSHDTFSQVMVSGAITGVCEIVMETVVGAYPVRAIIASGNPASDFGHFYSSDAWIWRLETTGSVDLAVTHLRGDSDGDGLPDWWELTYFGGRTAALPHDDPDADGSDNFSEYWANTHPLDPLCVLELISLHRDADGADVVGWRTASGRRYSILAASNLLQSSWSTAGVVSVYSEPSCVWTNIATPSPPVMFYSIAVEEHPP